MPNTEQQGKHSRWVFKKRSLKGTKKLYGSSQDGQRWGWLSFSRMGISLLGAIAEKALSWVPARQTSKADGPKHSTG